MFQQPKPQNPKTPKPHFKCCIERKTNSLKQVASMCTSYCSAKLFYFDQTHNGLGCLRRMQRWLKEKLGSRRF